jgi:hypothetical protein
MQSFQELHSSIFYSQKISKITLTNHFSMLRYEETSVHLLSSCSTGSFDTSLPQTNDYHPFYFIFLFVIFLLIMIAVVVMGRGSWCIILILSFKNLS